MKLPAAAPTAGAIAFAFAILYISWGTTYKATGIAVAADGERMPPALFSGTRLMCAGLILLVFQGVRGQPLRLRVVELAKLVGISWLLFLLGNWLITVGQTRIPSSIAAILAATTPLWMALFSTFWPQGERLGVYGWLGLIAGTIGVLLLFVPKIDADAADRLADDLPYLLLILGSAFCWGIGSVILRHMHLTTPRLTSAGYQMLIGGVSQVTLGLALGELEQLPMPPSAFVVGLFLYLLVVGSLCGFVAFNWLLGHVPAARVGTYAYVNPMLAIVVGWLLDESITPWVIAGMAVILGGVYLVRADHREVEAFEEEGDPLPGPGMSAANPGGRHT